MAHPSRLTRDSQGKSNVRARWVAKEYKTRTRPEFYELTPPPETLKVVLSEIATGTTPALIITGRFYFFLVW